MDDLIALSVVPGAGYVKGVTVSSTPVQIPLFALDFQDTGAVSHAVAGNNDTIQNPQIQISPSMIADAGTLSAFIKNLTTSTSGSTIHISSTSTYTNWGEFSSSSYLSFSLGDVLVWVLSVDGDPITFRSFQWQFTLGEV